jgi:hypothetical protein
MVIALWLYARLVAHQKEFLKAFVAEGLNHRGLYRSEIQFGIAPLGPPATDPDPVTHPAR